MASPSPRRPVLVTGMPRSGTTWLARELAAAPGAALPGKEPMNPLPGQFGLGHTLTGWTELTEPTALQRRLLRRVYAGLEPRTLSRYGVKQWAAALPWTATVIKDPFALLSVPAVVRVTGAVPVVLYRHPGAVLASYRRMGWQAGTAQIQRLQGLQDIREPADDTAAMVEFWSYLYGRVLAYLDDVPGCLLVSHAEVSLGGQSALGALREACGLAAVPASAAVPAVPAPPASKAGQSAARPDGGGLHRFDRAAEEVVEGWRSKLSAAEIDVLERQTADTYQALQDRRWRQP